MTVLSYIFSFILGLSSTGDNTRMMQYNGSSVKTTYQVPSQFYGLYKGRKSGYLELKNDGTGTYKYDVFGFAPESCKKVAIDIEWGFLVDEDDEVVSFSREYGDSFPILMKSVSETKFQGCRKEVLLDFIMVYEDGKIGVSSSDNWVKQD